MENYNGAENTFQLGEKVKVDCLCDIEGNELKEYDQRYVDLFKVGRINSIFCSDENGGYVYAIEGAKYCFNKFELKRLD